MAFVSMIMAEPHRVCGYYGSIVEQYERAGKTVFAKDTNPAYYYTSALAMYKMTEGFNSWIPKKYRKVKFHLLLAFRLMCEKIHIPNLSQNNSEKYCDYLCEMLCDGQKCRKGFEAAAKLVDVALGRNPDDKDRMSEELTKKIKEIAARAVSLKNSI